MGSQELLRALEQEADQRCRDILAQATARSEAMRAEASLTERQLQERILVRAEQEALVEARHMLHKARLEASRRVLTARFSVLEQLRDQSLATLRLLRQGPDYPGLLLRLLEEASAGLEPGAEVRVAPQDLELLPLPGVGRLDASECGVEVRAGGLIRRNTLASRLEKAWPALQVELARTLFGGPWIEPDYAVARVRGMLGRLLAPDWLNQLSGETPERLLERLRETPYARALEAPASLDPAARVEEALRRDLASCLTEVAKFSPTEVGSLLVPWEAHNLVTVLRGLEARAPAELVLAALVPTQGYPEPALAELCRLESPAAMLAMLASWGESWALELAHGLRKIPQVEQLAYLERGVHRALYEQAWLRSRGHLRTFLAFQLDAANLLAGLKLLAAGRSGWPEVFLPHGQLGARHWRRLLACSSLAAGLRLAATFPGLARALSGSQDLLEAEWLLELGLEKRARAWMAADPLGLGVMAGYIWRKVAEVRHLRGLLGRGQG